MSLHAIGRPGAVAPLSRALLGLLLLISCSPDHGLGPTVQGIRGTVHFHGTWPGDILEVRVVVSKTYPPESFLDLSGYSGAIPVPSDSAAYEVRLAPGEYAFVGVACRTSPNWDTQCVLGFYQADDDLSTPKPVEVGAGRFLGDIGIFVDFAEPHHSPGPLRPGRRIRVHRKEEG
jgi:hypothetical protein